MINQVPWATMKSGIDANPSIPYFYSTENAYASNDPNVPDVDRYYIRQEIQAGVNIFCFIDKDGSVDQIDWEDKYKSGGIETV